jgi:serine/threonine protein phosphatase 1
MSGIPAVPRLRELPENTSGRDFVVADLHGCLALFERELAARRFDPTRDRVLAVGDVIDRGADSARALELFAQPWFFSVRGNHEQAMLDWVDALLAGKPAADVRELAARHFAWGGDWALPLLTRALRDGGDALRPWHETLSALPLALCTSIRGQRVGIVHACVPGGDWRVFADAADTGSDEARVAQDVLWARRPAEMHRDGVRGIDCVYAGHNQVAAVTRLGNFHMIETAAWAGNALTLIEPGSAPAPREGWTARLFGRRSG